MNKSGNRKGIKHTPESIEKMKQAKLGKVRGKYKTKTLPGKTDEDK
jgi:hypothetical protein